MLRQKDHERLPGLVSEFKANLANLGRLCFKRKSKKLSGRALAYQAGTPRFSLQNCKNKNKIPHARKYSPDKKAESPTHSREVRLLKPHPESSLSPLQGIEDMPVESVATILILLHQFPIHPS